MTSKEAKDYLISLIKRDTRMKLKVSYDGHFFKKYDCSVCNSTLNIPQLKEVNFCPKCGQRLDWSERQ